MRIPSDYPLMSNTRFPYSRTQISWVYGNYVWEEAVTVHLLWNAVKQSSMAVTVDRTLKDPRNLVAPLNQPETNSDVSMTPFKVVTHLY